MVKSILDMIKFVPDEVESETAGILRDIETLDELADISRAIGINLKLEKIAELCVENKDHATLGFI